MKGTYKCNLDQLRDLAEEFASNINVQDVIALYGDLGTGKTTFARYFINYLIKVDVGSPTFNLVNLYDTTKFIIWHFDLYRLDNIEQVYNLGIEDALIGGVTIIEWPKIVESVLPKNTINISIEDTGINSRLVTIT